MFDFLVCYAIVQKNFQLKNNRKNGPEKITYYFSQKNLELRMKLLGGMLLLFSALMFYSCKSLDNNPVTTTTTIPSLSGTWSINYTGSNNDTLNVTYNINGTNGNLGGTGSGYYVQHSSGMNSKFQFSGTIGGTYTTSNIRATLSSFFLNADTSGTSGSVFIGTGSLIVQDTNQITFPTLTLQKN